MWDISRHVTTELPAVSARLTTRGGKPFCRIPLLMETHAALPAHMLSAGSCSLHKQDKHRLLPLLCYKETLLLMWGLVFLFGGWWAPIFWLQICWRRLPSSFVISPSPVRFPETERCSEGYVIPPPPPPVSAGFSRSRELREEHQTAREPGPRGQRRPSVSSTVRYSDVNAVRSFSPTRIQVFYMNSSEQHRGTNCSSEYSRKHIYQFIIQTY